MKRLLTLLLCLALLSCGEENANQDDQANVQVEPTKEQEEHLKKKLELPEDDEEGKTF